MNNLVLAVKKSVSPVQIENHALSLVTQKVKDIAGVEMKYLVSRTTKQFNKYLNGRQFNIGDVNTEITNFISTWIENDSKFSDWYNQQDPMEVHYTIMNLVIKSQLEKLSYAGLIESKELKLVVAINSSEMSPYRASQRMIKPLKGSITELTKEIHEVDFSSLDAKERDLLLEKANKLLDDVPVIVTHGLKDMADAIDSLIKDYRNSD